MSDLYHEFGSSEGKLTLVTDYCDPLLMVRNFYNILGIPEKVAKFDQIDALFVKQRGDLWDENWDYRCAFDNLPLVKNYLIGALEDLKEISDEHSNIKEPFRSHFISRDQIELWETGFFYWESDDQIKAREFIPAVTEFIEFIDKVLMSGSDLLKRTAD